MQRWARLVGAMAILVTWGCAPMVRPSVTIPIDRRVAFAEAVRLIEAERFADAVVPLQSLLPSYPELEDYHLYYLGVALVHTGREAEAAQLLRRLREAHPKSVWHDAAALALGRIETQRKNFAPARRALDDAAAGHDLTVARQARFELARLAVAEGDVAGAAAAFQQLRREAPGEEIGIQAKAELLRLRAENPELAPTGSLLLDELRILLKEGDLVSANDLANHLLTRTGLKRRGELLRLQARVLLRLGRVDDAIAVLRSSARGEPASMAAAIQFQIASILWNRDRDEEALVRFTRLRRRYPRAHQVPKALYAIGSIHEAAGRLDQAMAAYRDATKLSPRHHLGREAQWRMAWVEYGRGRLRAAEVRFARMARCRQTSDCVDALYWLARTRERQGRESAANEIYRRIVDTTPTSYYAMWAERRLGIMAATPVVLGPLVSSSPIPVTAAFHLLRARELKAAGLLSLAGGELAAYEREQAENIAELRRLLRWYPAVDAYGSALRLARRLGPQADLDSESRQRLMYPLGYWSMIQAATGAIARLSHAGSTRASDGGARIDPFLVAALIRQESLYDPKARSPANARGLMQLLPSTASWVAGARVAPTELYDPSRNITLGTRYLAQLLDRYQGDELKALAAYNGGEAAVNKWERRAAGRERDEFVELISYRETRDYVKKVVAGHRRYRQLYGATTSDS